MPATIEVHGKLITLQDNERQECEIYSRVMGYLRPVNDWNIGKRQEFKERHLYDESFFV